jgi:hypothetical protein
MKVKIKNIQWAHKDAYFFEVPEFNYYEGDEVKVKWCNAGQLALSTDNPEFSFRVLERKNIVEIDGLPYSYDVAPKQDTKIRFVKGSKGQTYEVTGNQKCTCPGFTFRGDCKHVKEMA